jgi:methionyl-tRNA formyltransferase
MTRKETGAFPYYQLPDVTEVCRLAGIPCSFDALDEETAAGADLILAATYHKMLPAALCRKAKFAINLHPSLLPLYRGPTPCYWVLRNRETETGITAHVLTDDMDAGDIYAQWRLPILPLETEGQLRMRLAELAAFAAVEVISAIRAGVITATPQDETKATYYPRPQAQISS